MEKNYEHGTSTALPPEKLEKDSSAVQAVEENHEMEVEFESEADLLQKMTSCKKNPGHKLFIPLPDFNESYLPVEHRNPEMMRLVENQATLTVRLRVVGSSPLRPNCFPGTSHPYPFARITDRKKPRTGSGWVETVMKYPDLEAKLCPCESCQKSGEPRKRWAEIGIRTAAHVVFDIVEGRKTTCYFFFDSDDLQLSACPFLRGAVDVKAALATDTCYMMFLTHDMELVDRLFVAVSQYQLDRYSLRRKLALIPEASVSSQAMKSRLSTRLGQGFELNTTERKKLDNFILADNDGFFNLVEQLANIFYQGDGKNFDVKQEMHTLLRQTISGGGQEGKEETEGQGEENQTVPGTSAAASCRMTEEDGPLLDNQAGDSIKSQATASKTKGHSNPEEEIPCPGEEHEKTDMKPETVQHATAGAEAPSFPERIKFSATYPLTIIVSHPHGGSKRITIGHIADRQAHWGDNFSTYTYTNATCPGSSGARVFIMGKSNLGDHAHSKFGNVQNGSEALLNESVTGPDI